MIHRNSISRCETCGRPTPEKYCSDDCYALRREAIDIRIQRFSPGEERETGRLYNRAKKTKAEAGAIGGASKDQNDTCLTTAEQLAGQHGVSPRIEEERAKERQQDHGGTAPGRVNTGGKVSTSDSGQARDKAAEEERAREFISQGKRTDLEHRVNNTELAKHGEIGNGRSRDKQLNSKGPTNEYLAARIKRDHAEQLMLPMVTA